MTKKPKHKPEAYRNKFNKDFKKKNRPHQKKKPIILGKYAWRPLWSRGFQTPSPAGHHDNESHCTPSPPSWPRSILCLDYLKPFPPNFCNFRTPPTRAQHHLHSPFRLGWAQSALIQNQSSVFSDSSKWSKKKKKKRFTLFWWCSSSWFQIKVGVIYLCPHLWPTLGSDF